MQYLLFRFDASSDIGLGHAFRCAALIEYINNHSSSYPLTCLVIARVLPEFLQRKLCAIGAQIQLLDESIDLSAEVTSIASIAQKYLSSVLVLDGYQFNQQYRQQLVKKCALKIAVFDDTNDLSQLYCQWVINALPDARQLGYERSAASAKHLLGLPYSIIRQEFLVQKPMFFSKRKNLLINFGGSDIGGLTLPIVKGIAEQLLMNNLDCSAQDVIVVTGGGCKNNKEIQTFCQQMGFHHIHQCEYMAKLLTKTRLAVCAPGAIVYELAYCQVPSIFLTVADNQLLSAKAHQQAGWGVVFDGRSDNDVQLALQEFTKLWQDKAQLKKMSSIAALLVDGKGVERIVSAITETYLDDEFEQQHEKNND